jgi:hypothetical protein
MRAISSLLCVVLLLALASAQPPDKGGAGGPGGPGGPGQPGESTYYPTKKGTRWTYKASAETISVEIKKVEKFGTNDQVELETRVGGTVVSNEFVFIKLDGGSTPDGLYRVAVSNAEVKPGLLFLKLPPRSGQSWVVNSKLGSEEVSGKFTSGEEKGVKVPAGSFDTITVSAPDLLANGKKMSLTYYFAENVGLVKQVAKYEGVEVVLELVKYEPPKE